VGSGIGVAVVDSGVSDQGNFSGTRVPASFIAETVTMMGVNGF